MTDVAPDDRPDRDLPTHECWDRLRSQAYGRLALVDDDGPMIYPINVSVDHGTLVFRTAAGGKLDALGTDERVAFEVDGVDADEGWSVVIRGVAEVIPSTVEAVEAVELGVTPWQGGPKAVFVRITPDAVTGRQFSRVDREEWRLPGDAQTRPTHDE